MKRNFDMKSMKLIIDNFIDKNSLSGGLNNVKIQDLWKKDDALVTDVIEESENVYMYDVKRCAYAEMYQEMGLAEIGNLLSCTRDFEFIVGYDPTIEITRTKTIMGGDSHCDFHYVRKAKA